jgi:hypothetical protein
MQWICFVLSISDKASPSILLIEASSADNLDPIAPLKSSNSVEKLENTKGSRSATPTYQMEK